MKTEFKDWHLYMGCPIWHKDAEKFNPSFVLEPHHFLYGNLKQLETGKIKLALRPLSDMTEEESKTMLPDRKYTSERAAESTKFLLSKRFDLFNLIESGQAIDKTILK